MDSYIIIDGWRANIRFSSAHIIHEYEKCGRLHGHSYAVNLKISGKLDSKGIIIDFALVKETIRKIVDELDHKILIPEKSKIATIKKGKGSAKITSLGKTYILPIQDCIFLPIASTSAENLSKYILEKFISSIDLPSTIDFIEIGVDEGFGQGARISKEVK